MLRRSSLTCAVVALILLFRSPLFAEGLTLSLSDPELGDFVLEKKNPVKTTCHCGIGGLSEGKFIYKGHWLGISITLGDKYPQTYVVPPGRYGCDCDMGHIIYDELSGFYFGATSKEDEKILRSSIEIDLSPAASAARIVEYDKKRMEELHDRREKMIDTLAALLEKYYDKHPQWQAEMGMLIRQKGTYKEFRRVSQGKPPTSGRWSTKH